MALRPLDEDRHIGTMRTTVKVNPEILVWARETAGLTQEDAVRKIGIKPARGISPVDRLSALEAGTAELTRPTLVKMAKQYRRPLLTFYLSAPPRKGDRGADFRTLSSDEHSATDDALLDALIREMQARQSMVRAVLEDEDEAEPLIFIGSRKISDGRTVVLQSLRALLDLDIETYYRQSSADEAFGLLRQKAEDAGVFVLLQGDLGSYHTAIGTELFRGFALADEVAPFIVINDNDSKAAWSFTLLHELVHLILGQTGVGGARVESRTERFCEDVAGEFLLPEYQFNTLTIPRDVEFEALTELIGEFARSRNLSHTIVAYKAYRVGHIEPVAFNKLYSHFRQQWLQQRKSHRERARARETGPDYYVVRRHRIGNGLLGITLRMMNAGALATSKAAIVLGVKPTQVHRLIDTGRVS